MSTTKSRELWAEQDSTHRRNVARSLQTIVVTLSVETDDLFAAGREGEAWATLNHPGLSQRKHPETDVRTCCEDGKLES
eukprot:61930-Amphidinium_carterae.1